MDSGNSGSISSSGDEEYDSRSDHHTLLPSTFLNHPTQFGSISHPQQSSLVPSHHHHQTQHHSNLFDLSSSYFHSLSQSQPNSLLNLDTSTSQGRRSEPNCTDPASLPGVPSSPSASGIINQCLFPPHDGLEQCATDPSHQLRSVPDDNNARVLPAAPTNAARNSKKRTRASRRAPTTVLTTDTSNFRAMVQEFTGIPAPPFSASSYPRTRRLDLLTGPSSSSTLRSSASHFDTTAAAFYPLRPAPQKLQYHPNPFVLTSSSSPSPSTLHNNNMVDAIASTTNISSSATTNNNSINYQLPPDLGLPYHQHSQNIMLSMQNHPTLAFHPAPPLHPLGNHVLAGFGAKTHASLSVVPPSLEDLGMSHGQVNNAGLVASGVSIHQGHGQVTSDGMTSASGDGNTVGGGDHRRDPFRSLDWGYGKVASADHGSCKLNFSSGSASNSLNHEKTLENTTTRGEGNVDSWICSSD